MNQTLRENEDILFKRLQNYKGIIIDQVTFAKYGISMEYSDQLSYKEREIFYDVIKEIY